MKHSCLYNSICYNIDSATVADMGCGISKDHPRNVELIRFKKNLDTRAVKEAKLIAVWVIGANVAKTLELAKMISDKKGYLLLTEDSLLQTEAESGSERGLIIDDILKERGRICPQIIGDLVLEALLTKLEGIHGVVFHGIPHNREQAHHLQRSIGPVSLVVYCELKGEQLKRALVDEGDDVLTTKMKVEHFQKSVIQLSRHKNAVKVDGEANPSSVLDECIQKLTEAVLD